ncbi:MAG: hypothetical protein PHR35_03135 [Kiritimatiellae bacterium]|nr:hypothetical protein [Kiritimatiellia bacterium]
MKIWERSTEAARIGPESRRVIMGRLRRHRERRNREVGAAPLPCIRPMLTRRFPVTPIRAALAPGGGTWVLRPVQEPPPGR